jgi:hypothetical protein
MEYTELSAKMRITRNRGKIAGKKIIHKSPGLKLLSAIDYLTNKHRYYWVKEDK